MRQQATGDDAHATGISDRLGQILGLLCIALLPLASGGYSGWGYQFGFVLLPLAALLCLPGLRISRAGAAVLALTLIAGSIAVSPLTERVHAGVTLWFCMLALLAAWIVTRSLLQYSPDLARWLFPLVTASSALTALAGLFPWWGHYLNAGDWDYYVVSSFGLHNAYAGFLLLAWPAAALAALQAKGALRAVLWAACGLLIATLFLTLSKASIAVFFLQVAVLLLAGLLRLARGRIAPRTLWPALAGGMALLVALLAMPTVRAALAQLTDLGGYSMQGRLRFWEAALRMFADHPAGVGLGNFRYAYPQYQRDWMYYSVDPHSWALQLLAELGVSGALIVLYTCIGFVFWMIRAVGVAAARPETHDEASATLGGRAGATATMLLPVIAVAGSLLHALFDFDYTFAATTALMGVLLAYGSYKGIESEPEELGTSSRGFRIRIPPVRAIKIVAAIWLVVFLFYGQFLTFERFVLDQLRNPRLSTSRRIELLQQAVAFDPLNESTQLELAQLLASQQGKRSAEAYSRATVARAIAPRNAAPNALIAALEDHPEKTDRMFQRALELDPYNHPEYYFAWAQAAQTPEQCYERLKLGVARIPAEHPITPDHIRGPDWIGFNPLWAKWWNQLAELEKDEAAKRRYKEIAARFRDTVTTPAATPVPAPGDSAAP